MSRSTLPVENLQHLAGQLIQAGIAYNSRSTYNTAIRVFNKFLSAYGFKSQLPIPVQHLTLFISYCFEKGLSPKSISTYVAGINYYHKLHGFYDLNGIFIVKKILEGCHRSRSTRDKRAPLTKHVLLAVCRSLTEVCFDSYEVKLFHSLFTLAYFGMFRVGELVNTNKHQQGNALLNEDVQITRDSSINYSIKPF